jgi:hypothetical protein
VGERVGGSSSPMTTVHAPQPPVEIEHDILRLDQPLMLSNLSKLSYHDTPRLTLVTTQLGPREPLRPDKLQQRQVRIRII